MASSDAKDLLSGCTETAVEVESIPGPSVIS
jgi:hypothetical protein